MKEEKKKEIEKKCNVRKIKKKKKENQSEESLFLNQEILSEVRKSF